LRIPVPETVPQQREIQQRAGTDWNLEVLIADVPFEESNQ
jgi:hypothetical protein